jgi:hypothetical protein
MPTKVDSTSTKSTFVDNLGTLISARRAFVLDKPQTYGFACVNMDGKLISGICDLDFLPTPRGTQVVVTMNKKDKSYRVW